MRNNRLGCKHTCDPDKLLGESARQRDVKPAGDHRNHQYESEEYSRIGIEPKALPIAIDSIAIEALERVVSSKR